MDAGRRCLKLTPVFNENLQELQQKNQGSKLGGSLGHLRDVPLEPTPELTSRPIFKVQSSEFSLLFQLFQVCNCKSSGVFGLFPLTLLGSKPSFQASSHQCTTMDRLIEFLPSTEDGYLPYYLLIVRLLLPPPCEC